MPSIKRKSILNGITILSIAGLVCKFVGVLYRIPLAWLVTEEGLGLYQLVFPSYAMLLTISSAGIPVAISKMISYSLAENDPRTAKKTFRIALYILTFVGFISTIIMLLGSGFLSQSVGNPKTQTGFMVIAPALLIVCVMSAFRGYMQGLSDMKPTAVSQLIEQVGKVLFSLPLAYYGMQFGVEVAASYALLGISLAELIALIFMYYKYRTIHKSIDELYQDVTKTQYSSKNIAKRLIYMAVPITLGATVVPLSSFVDSTMLVNRLCSIGMTVDHASVLYGLYSGLVITLINVPTALAIAISMSLVPAISSAVSEHNMEKIRSNSRLGLRFAFLIGLPCSFGMSVMAKPLLHFFYSSLGTNNIEIAANLLEISSFTIVLFTVVQATSGILQGMQKQKIPMYTLALGVSVKIVLNYFFVSNPAINIFGAPISSLVCYLISTVPNVYYVNKYCAMKFDTMNYLLRPGLASIGMAIVLYLLQKVLPFGRLSTLVLFFIGVAVFFVLAVLCKALTKEDWNLIRNRKKKHV